MIVGNFDRGGAEDLVSRFYDVPETSDGQADVDLWSVERKQRIHSDPLSEELVEENSITEPETTIVDVKQEQESMDISEEDPIEEIGPEEEAAKRHGLTLIKVECLVMTSMIRNRMKGALELREGGLGDHPRFHSLFYKGDLIPFVSCKECQKVFDWRPYENLDAHVKEVHAQSESINMEKLEELIR